MDPNRHRSIDRSIFSENTGNIVRNSISDKRNHQNIHEVKMEIKKTDEWLKVTVLALCLWIIGFFTGFAIATLGK